MTKMMPLRGEKGGFYRDDDVYLLYALETKARRGDGEYGRLYEGAEGHKQPQSVDGAERRWVLLKIPRGDTDELGEEQ